LSLSNDIDDNSNAAIIISALKMRSEWIINSCVCVHERLIIKIVRVHPCSRVTHPRSTKYFFFFHWKRIETSIRAADGWEVCDDVIWNCLCIILQSHSLRCVVSLSKGDEAYKRLVYAGTELESRESEEKFYWVFSKLSLYFKYFFSSTLSVRQKKN
jgi:hypothetical protein